MRVKKQQLEPDMEQVTRSKLGEEYIKQNARLDEAQSGIEIAERNISNLSYADDTTVMAESERNLIKNL